jgi:Putative restriction endonuclease
VGVPAIAHFVLPDDPYDLWVEGRLREALGVPDDKSTRVEIIGGEIVVSPGPLVDHAYIVTDVQKAFFRRELTSPDYPWRVVQVVDFNLPRISDGYIPDLIVLTEDEFRSAATAHAKNLTARQIGMAIEVTSKSTAADDRQPGATRERPTKWNGYAHEEVDFYLLVDRAPHKAKVTLFADPNPARGIYEGMRSWKFGEKIVLPEPFGVEILTDAWRPWGDVDE